jgi:hypothetical protein
MFFAIGLPEIRAPFNSMLSIIDLTFGAARMEVAGRPTTAYNDLIFLHNFNLSDG